MNSLDRTLELFASNEADASAIGEAQRRLDALIAARIAARPVQRPVRHARGWLTAAASAAVVALVALWLPFGSAPALAFAQVQQHFRDFRTLRFDLEQHMNGQVLMKARVSVRHDGSVRTEVGDDVIVIVNSAEKRVLSLIKSARLAVVSPIDAAPAKEDSLEWLDDIQKFQGAAEHLPAPRVIDGKRAEGWELQTDGGRIVLWADAEGLPLEMTLDQPAAIEMTFHFEFEPQLPAEFFSTEVPAGYSLEKAED